MKKFVVLYFFISFFILVPLLSRHVLAASTIHLGIMSDSSSDEYRADDNRGGSYGNYTFCWDELLVKYRNIDLGVWGTRSEPRRSGYEYNWARSGAEAATLISSGQHTGLAAQIAAGKINLVYFQIGNNDFAYYRQGADIYNGTLSGTALDNKINAYLQNVTTALNTIIAANQNIKIIFGTTGDPGKSPYWASQFPDITKRQRVTDVVNRANHGIKTLAAAHANVLLFDIDQQANVILAKINPHGKVNIGGELIDAFVDGDEPHHFILGDNIHGGTIAEGLFVNEIIPLINQAMGINLPLFNDIELLNITGIRIDISPSPTIKPGDSNNDGIVNGTDFVTWLNHYGQRITGVANGDYNNDGTVNGADFVVWLTHYGM